MREDVFRLFFNKYIETSYLFGIFVVTVEKLMLFHCRSGIFAMLLQCSVAGIYFPLHSCSCSAAVAAER